MMGAPVAPVSLLLWALLLGAVAEEFCPEQCSCSDFQELDTRCDLPRSQVVVKGEPGGYLKLICNEDGEGFTFEELPALPYGSDSAIRLEIHYCPIPPTFAAAAAKLGASAINSLYIHSPVGGVNITAEVVAGLDKLERLAIYAERSDNISIPSEAFSRLPSLERFTINNGNVALRNGDFATAPGLKYLELTNCNIAKIPDGAFSMLSKLENLIIWKNKIEELTEKQLEGLESLQQLSIASNKLSSLRDLAATQHLQQLKVLSAYDNRFVELVPLRNLTKLEKVEIFFNKVPLTIAPAALSALPNLQTVTLSRSGIKQLPADVFSESRALISLKLDGNQLETILPETFKHQVAMKELDLSRNQLSELKPYNFKHLRSLETLELKYNNLKTLPANVLSGLQSLTRLSVSHNQLRTLTSTSFTGARDLQQLDLSYNNITDSQDYMEKYLLFSSSFGENIRVLDLSHNGLTRIPAEVQAAAVFLETLNLSHNNIQEVYDANFVSNSATVDLTYNNIRTIQLLSPSNNKSLANDEVARSKMVIDDNPFDCDCRLYVLAQRLHGFTTNDTTEAHFSADNARCAAPASLMNRRIRSLPLRDFACQRNETNGCVAGCECAYRPYTDAFELTCASVPKTYPNITQYDQMHLQMRLTTKPTSINIDADIQHLNLSGLGISELPEGFLPHSLKSLDLTNNNFTKIPTSLLHKDLILHLAGNPIICDCWHDENIAALNENRRKIADYYQVNCIDKVPVSQQNVQQLCSAWRASVIGGVLAMIGVITAVAALLALNYSFEIKVWLYTRGMFARWFVIDDDDRKYDAFISFCHKDEDFVNENLLPGLEGGPQPYKLCVHYRDWMPGEFITNSIAQSVADSRRTIIVVSKNFLESQWARAEFRTANMSAIKERKTRVIVVLLEDVNSHKELDPELKAYLSTNTYLKWGDPWFWNKLRYALPHRKNEAAKAKSKVREKIAKARALEACKVVKTCGIDTQINRDGLIINAAALAVPHGNDFKKCEQINLDICKLDKMKSLA